MSFCNDFSRGLIIQNFKLILLFGGPSRTGLHTLIIYLVHCSCFHTVSWTLYFGYRVRHLTSVQSLIRAVRVHYFIGRVGRVIPSKVVWSKITLLQLVSIAGVMPYIFKNKYIKIYINTTAVAFRQCRSVFCGRGSLWCGAFSLCRPLICINMQNNTIIASRKPKETSYGLFKLLLLTVSSRFSGSVHTDMKTSVNVGYFISKNIFVSTWLLEPLTIRAWRWITVPLEGLGSMQMSVAV